MHKMLVIALAAIGLLYGITPAARAAEAPVDVLILSTGDLQPDKQLVEQFGKEGVRLVTRKLYEPLSAAMLRQFHVVLIADWEGDGGQGRSFLRTHVQETLTARRNTELLQTYIADGGGFFFTPLYGSEMSAEALTRFLQPYAATVQCAGVRDDAHAYSSVANKSLNPPDYYEYAWTTAITKHSATQGVQRLFYPTSQLRWDNLYATPVVTASEPAWTVLVKGMPTSRPSRGFDYYTWQELGTTPPVIAAVRNHGAGRVGIFTPCYHYTLRSPFTTPKDGWYLENHTGKIDGILMDKGNGQEASQGRQLMLGMLRWLGDGARAKGFGGYDEKTFAALEKPAPVPTPGWLYSWTPTDGNRWFMLLVGAHSAFSDGTGTVAEYAAAAKAAGVSMLVMTEAFERFNPARWTEYRAACAQASDDALKVVAGLDIPDAYGNRYLLFGSPVFPAASLLTPDGKAMARPNYLCLCFPKGITVIHRSNTSTVPHELLKHFQAVSVYTYRNGVMEDNSYPAYAWEVFRFSNPLPFVVHETYAPADLTKEATAGHQLFAAAPTLADLDWYLGAHGTAHFWESPLHLQISSGPMITALGGSIPDPEQPSVRGNLGFSLHSDEPITEVALWENFTLLRRWTPNAKDFTVNNVKLPDDHANWMVLTATDAKGRTVVSPGVSFGKQIVHTWRCADRQNWWCFPNLYTGTDLCQIDLRVPAPDTAEGTGIFPNMQGPRRGENMAALLDFPLASTAVYIQDAVLDQRYPRALYTEVAYDAKPSNTTARSRVYEAKIRYHKFYVATEKAKENDYLPLYNEVTITLRRPLQPNGAIFPILTTLDTKHMQVRGDMSYAYTDPATGKDVTGTLKTGYLDLPKGGRVGGFIALSDGIRVGANGLVGFAAPAWVNGALPAGTRWIAAFSAVQPAEADAWRSMMGLCIEKPYTMTLDSGKLTDLAYLARADADGYGIAGRVEQALRAEFAKQCRGGLINRNKEGEGVPVTAYRMPFYVNGVNYNWPAAVVRGGVPVEDVPVFEGIARARLDVGLAGAFYIGNTVLSDQPNLRVALLGWSTTACSVEVNNPTDSDMTATVRTAPRVTGRFQGQTTITVKAGTSQIVHLK